MGISLSPSLSCPNQGESPTHPVYTPLQVINVSRPISPYSALMDTTELANDFFIWLMDSSVKSP